jgi:hypothetical protein
MALCLRRFVYLDHEGITSLHSQVSQGQLLEHTKTFSSSKNKLGTGGVGANFWAVRGDISASIGSSKGYTVSEKSAPADENLLLGLEGFLAEHGALEQMSSIRAVAEVYAKGVNHFVTGVLRFRWAFTHSNDPVEDAIKKQMIEFTVDRDSYDDGGMVGLPIRLAGNLRKCVDRKNLHDGSISPTSHLAVFLRSLARGQSSLGFFAQMQPLPELIYLKPYAIWFP